jgi:NAD(P)H-dependent flavin oxidoreductase YrpB (nitropropane dioxygenase family)
MRTPLVEMFDIEYPIFAFSHCRDVVAAVTNAGGFGVLGAAMMDPQRLDTELRALDAAVGGRPYGVDVVMPARQTTIDSSVGRDGADLGGAELLARFAALIPNEHREFTEKVMAEHGVGPLADPDAVLMDANGMSAEGTRALLEVAFSYPISLLVNALGPMPGFVAERAKAAGIRTAGLVGSAEHAHKQVASGVDLIVAQGTEAGGHCGDISTMVLTPEVVDAVAPVPVLAAGGIGTGRQVAAALALGAAGVWTGSIWLTCAESDVVPAFKDGLLAAGSRDTVRSRAMSGKPCRQLRTAWTEAWDSPDSPGPLQVPLQSILYAPVKERVIRSGARGVTNEAVGQIVGTMNSVRSARDIVYDLATGTAEAAERLNQIVGTDD